MFVILLINFIPQLTVCVISEFFFFLIKFNIVNCVYYFKICLISFNCIILITTFTNYYLKGYR